MKTEVKKQEKKKVKNKRHFDIKKNFGRLVALIVLICMLLATSGTLIFYLIYYI